jgi:hypothetical protein
MKGSKILLLLCLGVIAITGLLYLHPLAQMETYSQYEYGSEEDNITDAFTQWHIDRLAEVRQGCADYYDTHIPDPNPATTTQLLPLESYICGQYSDVKQITFTSGRKVYFVAIDTSINCDGMECWYYAFLEERPGLVRPLIGFNGYLTNEGTGEVFQMGNTQDEVFGSLTFDPKHNLIKTYEKKYSPCGIENIYQIDDSFPPPVHLMASHKGSCGGMGSTTLFTNIDGRTNGGFLPLSPHRLHGDWIRSGFRLVF